MYTKHPYLVKIGKKIQALRKQRDLSQEEFAYQAGLARTYMGRVERGEQNLSLLNLIKIAMALHVEVSDIIPKMVQLKR
jgi:transcriptional regulator with XRE-family HTH domain